MRRLGAIATFGGVLDPASTPRGFRWRYVCTLALVTKRCGATA